MSEQTVKRRHVFYVPGYDPFHPRRYRELYRREAAEQARISGYDIALSPKSGDGPYGWHVVSNQDGFRTETDVEVLVWHDIVQSSMNTGLAATYWQMLYTSWVYLSSGALFRLMRLRKGPMIAALYPVIFLLVQAIFAAFLGWAIFLGGITVFGQTMIPSLVFAIVGLGGAYLLLDLFRRHDSKVFAYYLMHDYAFSAQHGGATPDALRERLVEFGTEVSKRINQGLDEVLIVGHSSGAHLGVSMLADLLRDGRLSENKTQVSFLTLGHVVPMVSFLPKARGLRSDLHLLGKQDIVTWIDVSAPGDGCAFALCDPVAVTGVADKTTKWPIVISAAFTQTLSQERWKSLRWKFFKLHFQYLCAFDHPGDYDYFRVTAGYQTLAERFAGRAPSRSRICKPISGFQDYSE